MATSYRRGPDGVLIKQNDQRTLRERYVSPRDDYVPAGSLRRRSNGRLARDVGKVADAGNLQGKRKTRDRHGKTTKRQPSREPVAEEVLTGTPDAGGEVNVTAATLSPKWYEICRKISYGILTQQGMYEVPPLWDDTESSPTWSNGLPDPTEPWFKVERPHEIWYMDDNLNRHIETFYVATGLSDPVVTSIPLIVIPALINTDVNILSRVISPVLNSPEAQAAIAQAQAEV